ncbi:hypothetical protein BDZ94DRAFT_721055 [Collybia nuda]|uniref:Uncharacterized protein n=1 Tax=Collybia nuda TaxID=64659 RepID=A0A9P6CE32_9AGAR|nr:hypothetical protein BDZ94DRAFT_721055 [Collybia nuda]
MKHKFSSAMSRICYPFQLCRELHRLGREECLGVLALLHIFNLITALNTPKIPISIPVVCKWCKEESWQRRWAPEVHYRILEPNLANKNTPHLMTYVITLLDMVFTLIFLSTLSI